MTIEDARPQPQVVELPVTPRPSPYLHSRVLSDGGPPMVMVHGLLTGSMASWYLTVAPTFVADYEVVLYDLRGHGRSDRTPSGYDLVTMRGDLERVIADRPPVVLVGHSYGALIALRYALDFPARVDSLIMIEPPMGRLKPRDAMAAGLFKSRGRKGGRANSAPDGKPRTRAQRRSAARIRGLLDETQLAEEVFGQKRFGRRELQACLPRSLTVFGASSFYAALADQMKSMPYNTVELVPGGHDVHLTATADLCRLITDFLSPNRYYQPH